jgi:hypothetical protein
MTTNAKAIASQVLEVVLFACALGLMLPPINWHPRLGVSILGQVMLPAGFFAASQVLAAARGKTFWWAAILNVILFAVFGWEWYRALIHLVAT